MKKASLELLVGVSHYARFLLILPFARVINRCITTNAVNRVVKQSAFILSIWVFATSTAFAIAINVENSLNANANAKARASTHSIEKWEVLDILINNQEIVSEPFLQNINASFTHESGKTQTVPVVYNGNKQWLLRFSSSHEGKWQYEINDGSFLNGNHGNVEVTSSQNNNHGAMVISPNKKQHFAYEDGTDYFLLGYELDWLFALDYERPLKPNQSASKALPKSDHLLSLLKKNGFNHVVMNVYAHDVNWDKDPKLAQHPEHEFGGKQSIFPFLGTNDEPDFSSLNVEFFKKLDRTIALLHDKRMVSHLMIYVWNKEVSWPDMNTEADNMYFDYVAKRYGAFPNIVWDISKEALYYGRADEAYIKNRIERLRAINHFERLVTVHDYKYCSKYPEQVDFISTQDWGSDIYNRMLNVRKRFPNKVIYNIEHGGYEESPYTVFPGDYTNAEVVVRRNWLTLFAGVYSTHYWQANAWNVIIYNPYENPDKSMHPKFEYFESLSEFFTRFPFSDFTPAPGKNGSGYNLVNKDATHLIYVSKDNYQMSRGGWYLMPKDDGTNIRNFYWFNTLTGEYTKPARIVKGQQFISPWRSVADAVLITEVIKP
jgi:hypothetical protein